MHLAFKGVFSKVSFPCSSSRLSVHLHVYMSHSRRKNTGDMEAISSH